MELGCELPVWFVKELEMNYTKVEFLPPDSIPQFERALSLYRNGVPYNFQSKGLLDTVQTGKPQHDDNEINYQALEDIPVGEEITKDNTKLNPMSHDFNHPVNSCGNCGSRQSFPVGGKLKRCAGCKKRLYCSENCKKWHWDSHHRQCGDSEQSKTAVVDASEDNDVLKEKVMKEQ